MEVKDLILSAARMCLLISICTKDIINAAYAPLGCYYDSVSDRDLDGKSATLTSLSASSCASLCQSSGFPYAGLQAGSQCFCGNKYGFQGPSTECNFTCGNERCGGVRSNSVYYAIDPSLNFKRSYGLGTGKAKYVDARSACVTSNGDLVTPTTQATINNIINYVTAQNDSSIEKVWIGLRRMYPTLQTGPYMWTNEPLPFEPTYFAAEQSFSSFWTSNDPQLEDCVSLVIKTKLFESIDCASVLPFVCNQLPDLTAQGVYPNDTSSILENSTPDSKTIALYVVLPIFLFCYGGSCILYCIHKLVKNCSRKKNNMMLPPLDEKKLVPIIVAPPPPMISPPLIMAPPLVNPPARQPFDERKMSHPAPPPPFMEMAGPLPEKTPPPFAYLHANNPQNTKRMSFSMFDDDDVARGNDPPPSYSDKKDERKARLLENAAREARERRQTPDMKQPTADESAVPETTRLSANLLPRAEPRREESPSPNLAGLSINEILKIKMEQQASKKRPRKIVAA